MERRVWFLSVFAALMMGWNGCTSLRPYRTTEDTKKHLVCIPTATQSCAAASLMDYGEYLLGLVEFDDLGWFWNRRQKEDVVEAIKKEAAERNVLIVAFAHGWNHNAKYGDSNEKKFREILARLAKLEQTSAPNKGFKPRRIIGVYLGWRGKAFKGGGHSLTALYNWTGFFTRKATAHRVGSEDAAALLSALDDVRSESHRQNRIEWQPSRLVVVGHSFGSAVVYGAISRLLAERRLKLKSDKPDFDAASFGDLVVLVNPAIEESLLFPFQEATEAYQRSEARSAEPAFHPILAVFSSQADGPNKLLFPVARRISTLFKHYRSDIQAQMARRAAGQFQPTISLLLCPAGEKRSGSGSMLCDKTSKLPAKGNEDQAISWPRDVGDQVGCIREAKRNIHDFQRGRLNEIRLCDTELIRVGADSQPVPLTPYPEISVDSRLIASHNDIFNNFFTPFLINFIAVWQDSPPPATAAGGRVTPQSTAPEAMP